MKHVQIERLRLSLVIIFSGRVTRVESA